MKKILIVINTMGRAGAETALISFLQDLDYTRYSVSLLSIIGIGTMFERVPKQVNLLNENPTVLPVFGPKATLYIAKKILRKLFKKGYIFKYFLYAIKNIKMQLQAGKFNIDKLFWLLLADSAPVTDVKYDLAIAFIEGASTYYVSQKVQADKKASFVHVNYKKAGYIKELDYMHYEKMDYIFGISEAIENIFNDVYPEFAYKTHTFYNIMNKGEIMSKAQVDSGFSDDYDGIRIVTTARLHWQKGLDIAIEAFAALVHAGYTNVRWYILGDGPEKAKLKSLIKKHGLQNKFILANAKDNPYPYVLQADIYAQPSRFEGLSIAVVEALILNKPVLTTNCDGIRNLLADGENAIIVEAISSEITDALKRLIDDAQLRNKLAEGTKLVKFEFDNTTEDFFKVIYENDCSK